VTPESDGRYRVRQSNRMLVIWLRLMAVLAGVVAVLLLPTHADRTIALLAICAGLVAIDLVIFRRLPNEIWIDGAGIHFDARARRSSIPWDTLTAISAVRSTIPRLRWHADVGDVVTWNGYERQSALFSEIQRRAPHVTSLP
jgi:hypothetical protein